MKTSLCVECPNCQARIDPVSDCGVKWQLGVEISCENCDYRFELEAAPVDTELITAAYKMLQLAEEFIDNIGGCDHEVGICSCGPKEDVVHAAWTIGHRLGLDRKLMDVAIAKLNQQQ